MVIKKIISVTSGNARYKNACENLKCGCMTCSEWKSMKNQVCMYRVWVIWKWKWSQSSIELVVVA